MPIEGAPETIHLKDQQREPFSLYSGTSDSYATCPTSSPNSVLANRRIAGEQNNSVCWLDDGHPIWAMVQRETRFFLTALR